MLRTLLAIGLSLSQLLSVAQAQIQVVDDTDMPVVLAHPAQRIVSLAPHLTELLFSIGVGARIVGTVRFSDYPAAARAIPVLGDAFTVNIESIIAREPDLVVAWHTGGTTKIIEKLRGLGVAVYVNEAGDLPSIATSTQKLSVLVGRSERGEALKQQFTRQLQALRTRNRQAPTRVFFQISDQGLYTVNDTHLIGQAMSVCGVENVFGSSVVPVPIVSKESVLAASPDVIVISQPTAEVVSPWVKKWSEIEDFGVKIRQIDPALISRPSLRMIDGIDALCRITRDIQTQ